LLSFQNLSQKRHLWFRGFPLKKLTDNWFPKISLLYYNLANYGGQAQYFNTDYETARSLVEDAFLERTATVNRLKEIITIAVKIHTTNWIAETSKFQQILKDANTAFCMAINEYANPSQITQVEDINVERLQQYHKFFETIIPHYRDVNKKLVIGALYSFIKFDNFINCSIFSS
jgi:hypothetical protein